MSFLLSKWIERHESLVCSIFPFFSSTDYRGDGDGDGDWLDSSALKVGRKKKPSAVFVENPLHMITREINLIFFFGARLLQHVCYYL